MNVVDLNLSKTTSVEDLIKSYSTTGFQATELAQAREVLERMYSDKDCFKFLSFTANMVASGLRGVFAQLIADGRVDAVITTGGSIDHDIIKCFNPYQIGSFHEDDIKLIKRRQPLGQHTRLKRPLYSIRRKSSQYSRKSLRKTTRFSKGINSRTLVLMQ